MNWQTGLEGGHGGRPWVRYVLCLVALVAGSARPAGGAGAAESIHPEQWPTLAAPLPVDPTITSFVDQLLAQMSLEDKVGQLIQADIDSVTPEDFAHYHLGSILAGGNAAPGHDVRSGPAPWLDLTEAWFRASSARTASSHVSIPVLFGIDAVHGHAKIRGATVFPHNVGLGAAHDPALIRQIGEVTAEEVTATGIDWTFAPTVAVVRDVRWGRSYESYSEDPALVAGYARAMLEGLQGTPGTPGFLAPPHTLGSAKHFLGDGGTLAGRDQFDNLASEAVLRDVHAAGYAAAIPAGALIVMASYNGWQGVKMHANHALLTEVLKDRWRFPGFVVGDWNAHEEIPGCTKYSCPQFLNAGGDMYMAPDSWRLLYGNLLQQIQHGDIAMTRVDDAVRRILTVKKLAGLFATGGPRQRAAGTQVGSPAHRETARRAVRESLVLLKNNHQTLPLNPHNRVLVLGPGADDIGMQSGGWTVDWQGNHNTNSDFPGATSILAGIRAAVTAAGGEVVTRDAAIGQDRPAAAMVVYGESPYAEFQGDRENLRFAPPHSGHLALLQRLRKAGIPVVSVFLSGRPLWVNREINLSDAFVAAWLPGSEGAGIADLLFTAPDGSRPFDFTGRLAFSWPATAMPVAFGAGNAAQGVQFPVGAGLSLQQDGDLGALAEDPAIKPAYSRTDTLFHAGHVTAPWSVFVEDATAEVRLTMQSQSSPLEVVTAAVTRSGLQVHWSGNANAEMRIGGRAIELAGNGSNLAVQLRYRLAGTTQGPVILSARCEQQPRCGLNPGAGVDIAGTLRSDAVIAAGKGATWHTLQVPLRCLSALGAKFAAVTAPLALESASPLDITIGEARLVSATQARCPASP